MVNIDDDYMTDEPTSPENLPADDTASTVDDGALDPSTDAPDSSTSGGSQDDSAAPAGDFGEETVDEAAFWQDYARLNDPFADVGQDPGDFGGAAPPPPPYGPQEVYRSAQVPDAPRLVRDPYSRLGGVSSGIAHYYGFDVSLIRLAFVLATIFSGSGLLAYIVAWIVIPRAEYWPAAPRPHTATPSNSRTLGTALLIAGAVFAFIFGGSAGSFLIPVLLVGGGVWLLVQEQRPEVAPAMAGAQFSGADPYPSYGPAPAGPADQTHAPYGSPGHPGLVDDSIIYGAPVPPRSRRRGIGFAVAVIVGVLALIAIPVMLFLGLAVASIESGAISFDGGEEITERPLSIDAFPIGIDESNADVVIDLTALDLADFEETTGIDNITADVGFGNLTVIVPDGVAVSVDAEAGAGDVSLFGDTYSGFGNSIQLQDPEADLSLDLNMGLGDVEVVRG